MSRFWLFLLLTCSPLAAQTENDSAIIFADQYTQFTYQQIVTYACPTAGCTIYATSPNAGRDINVLDPGSKFVTLYLGPFTYMVDHITLRKGLRIIGAGANGTTLQAKSPATLGLFVLPQMPQINTPAIDVYLYGFLLEAAAGNTAQSGILLDCVNLTGGGLWHSKIEDVSFSGFFGSAMFFIGPNNSAASANQMLSLRNITAFRPLGGGPDLRIEGANGQIDCIECQLDGPGYPTSDGWANIFIGNLSGGTVTPYSIHFFNLTSQSAHVAVQIQGGVNLTFIGSHHEALDGAYLFTNEGTITSTNILISNAFFAGNVGRNNGNGYLVNADNATNIVLDAPCIAGGSPKPPDFVVAGASQTKVSVRNAFNPYATNLYSVLSGNVTVTGTLIKSAGSFRIDDPVDPSRKYLSHSFVESPDMKNIYDGVATLDKRGQAEVRLPDWFQALNRDFRYQLTCIGRAAPVYIAQEVHNNRFRIAGGRAGLKVSWQITGTRHDSFANANRIPVEENKPKTKPSLH